MADEIIRELVKIIIHYIIPLFLGYLLSSMKIRKKENDSTKKALITLLQSNLTNTYYVYDITKEIPNYVYRNWLNEFKVYEELGGNDFIHVLAKKMESWSIKHTDEIKDINES